MTLEEKIGQLFMLAFSGSQIEHAHQMLNNYFVGACYISQDNAKTPAEARQLTRNLQELATSTRNRIPLILGVDQEGAWGVMVPYSSTGPGNMALGAANDPMITHDIYQVIGTELKSVGYNTLLAPCIDVISNPDNVLGARSFGEYPERVAEQGVAAVEGARSAGVITTAKHYPGHGDARQDSHRMLPTVDRSLEELEQIDLLPYKYVIRAGVDIVMTAHILYPKIDPVYPATMSYILLQDILRGKLGFQGVILSDSMNMLSIRKNYAPDEAAILAIQSGVDMIMLAEEHYDHSSEYLAKQKLIVEGVLKAARLGNIPMTRIDNAVMHVLTLKSKAGLFEVKKEEAENEEIVGSHVHRQVELTAADHAITLVRDQRGLVKKPLTPAKTAVVRTTPRSAYDILTKTRGIGPNQEEPCYDVFEKEMQKYWPDVQTFAYESLIEQMDLSQVFNSFDVVIAVTEDYPLPGVDFNKIEQHYLVKRMIKEVGDKLLVLGFCPAYEFLDYEGLGTYICAHSSRACAGIAAARKITGKMIFDGDLPIKIYK